MSDRVKKLRLLPLIIIGAAIFGIGYLGKEPYKAVATIHDLLAENKNLKQAIKTLTDEDQIGYAKVINQQFKDGQLLTTLKFVETARGDKLKTVLERQYTIAGDIIHFDALIVKFGNKMVTDGKTRALYLWRRVYGERMSPAEGFPIEVQGAEPKRYRDLLESLPIEQRHLFWSGIWDLANDPEKLAAHDIEAIYGNVVYTKLRRGLIYVFKIYSTGQVCPEVVPDI
ncbi:MAG: hypothetical protein JSW47_02365 [Phycisphaerales bacterium]|nr:MAG: hypothetical protein JSW47_02365 [Phycisphaerales bacterium]UCF14783.1 MAG: hypothetical protein JSW59_15330 [Phycisphaerales bacterium]